ncbi:hypothetical protein MFMK1_002521 [Metallumcola ferriviriculae]|uniref:IclR-ED domain-containing protein n=1 Tax=Metallumcola ferriviriculae TaxID=3039180 RepID=A0AAU0UQ13_9FIRM|nr:hypothetical protein MFMK1_002521 [Desulfitibacteraceae bacterium MK1]
MNQMDLRKAAIGPMRDLSRRCDETIILFISDGRGRTCLERIDSNHVIRNFMVVGHQYPLHKGAPGKVFLMNKSPGYVKGLLESKEYSDQEIERFNKELEQGLELGYFTSIEENFTEAYSIAAPIFDHTGNISAALAVCGPTARLTEEKEDWFGTELLQTVAKISAMLGYNAVS